MFFLIIPFALFVMRAKYILLQRDLSLLALILLQHLPPGTPVAISPAMIPRPMFHSRLGALGITFTSLFIALSGSLLFDPPYHIRSSLPHPIRAENDDCHTPSSLLWKVERAYPMLVAATTAKVCILLIFLQATSYKFKVCR